jgi:hypothetical protein
VRRTSFSCGWLVALTACAAGDPFGLPQSGAVAVARVRTTRQPAAEVAAIVAEVMAPRCCGPLGARVVGAGSGSLSAVVAADGWVAVAGTPEQVRQLLELIERLEDGT